MLLGLPWLAAACQPRELQPLIRDVADLKHEIQRINTELITAWSIIFCGEKIQQMLGDVDKECGRSQDAAEEPISQCTTKRINPAVIDADDSHRGLLLNVLRRTPSVIFPLASNATELPAFRTIRLDQLVKSRLRSTRFLIVARSLGHPQGELEARNRAQLIIDRLTAQQVPSELIRVWLFNFQMSRQDLKTYQTQLHPGEPAEINTSVWVFRVDC